MLNKITNFCLKNPLLLLLSAAIFALGFAYISQYFFNYQPCILCLYQRKPFFLIILTCLAALLFFKSLAKQRISVILCSLFLLINIVISSYHVGVEKKIFAGPNTCSSQNLDEANSLEELAAALEKTKAIRCDEPSFIFLTLSMTEWNLIYCLGLLGFSLLSLNFSRKNSK